MLNIAGSEIVYNKISDALSCFLIPFIFLFKKVAKNRMNNLQILISVGKSIIDIG